ncbi:hypothetical protein GCM10011375_41040 [Hymenobacter qilianensis]|uniref:Uncharacterized protein n=1 Tax=Hymenobacter qilianensis TaxID=1385715 RepID=A0ACB5PXJ7_9BACT|nr:hypothetical protein GCM10011375_41040 [Hymenobacter qilianensis]
MGASPLTDLTPTVYSMSPEENATIQAAHIAGRYNLVIAFVGAVALVSAPIALEQYKARHQLELLEQRTIAIDSTAWQSQRATKTATTIVIPNLPRLSPQR